MHKYFGSISKMQTNIKEDLVYYKLPIGKDLVDINNLVGKKITLEFTKNIYDIYDGTKIKKTYGGGYSYKNFISLARCDSCIVSPEKCHYENGTCREPLWGEKHCLKDHMVYLSVTSSIKVGVTRLTQIPTRWIDQGATYAIPLVLTNDRKTAGLIEVELKEEYFDKTNWRKMLKDTPDFINLSSIRDQIYNDYGELFDDLEAQDSNDPQIQINYPIQKTPCIIKSTNFDKQNIVKGKLIGIKGQYLLFEDYCINIRKHSGYEINLSWD